jgi:DNA-binding IclR family transcriptional regulator
MATQREQVRNFLRTAPLGARVSSIALELRIPEPSVRRIVGELRRAHNIERIGRRIRMTE